MNLQINFENKNLEDSSIFSIVYVGVPSLQHQPF